MKIPTHFLKFTTFSLAISSVIFFSSPALVRAESYQIDTAHSQVMFKVKHLGISSVTGRFDDFAGKIEFNPAKIAASKVEATINVLSINTNNKKRDGHLASCDFFCAEQFGKMSFVSKEIKDLGSNKFQIIGELTLHGISKAVTLDAEYGGQAKAPGGAEHIAFAATTSINRKEFGLKWDKLTETGGIMVGDKVDITLEIEAVKG